MQVSICGIHRDPKVWGTPDEYTPERWVEGSPLEATDARRRPSCPLGTASGPVWVRALS